MTTERAHYLERIRQNARLESAEEPDVMGELEAHIDDTVCELTGTGLTEEEAVHTCITKMGNARLLARQIYEAHAQGTWKTTLLAAMPHLVFAAIFALNWWHHPGWVTLTLLLTLTAILHGWWHGKPNWVFTWLGISLVPVLIAGILLLYIPRMWSPLALVIYLPLALWWVFRIIVEITRRDWLFASLALIPLPVAGGWIFALVPDFRITPDTAERVAVFAPWIALSFLGLALTIIIFIRLRQRWLRIGLMVCSGLGTLALVIPYSGGHLGTGMWFGLSLVMWGVFLFPPLLERCIRCRNVLFWKHRKIMRPPSQPGM